MNECRKLLVDTTLHQLATMQHVIILQDTATVDQALKTLANHKILSAPVVLGGSKHQNLVQWPSEEGTLDILGFLDVRDILNSFLEGLDIDDLVNMKLLQRMRILEEKGAAFSATPIRSLTITGGDGDFLHATQAKVSLLELIAYGILNPQLRGLHGGSNMTKVVHRVAVFDSAGRITSVVSQSDIVRFLHRHADRLAEVAQRTVRDLGFLSHGVECTRPEVPAIAAMAHMVEKGMSSLAVVNEQGAIIGNFSASEMRTIMAEHFGSLGLPVGEFLALEHGTEFVSYRHMMEGGVEEEVLSSPAHQFVQNRQARARPHTPGEQVGQDLVLCLESSSLHEVMELLVRHRIHRVYVVDAKEQPIGIITCTDVLSKVVDLVK